MTTANLVTDPLTHVPADRRLHDRRQPDRQALHADGRRMLTLQDAAGHLDTNVATVRKLIACGTLKAVKLSARCTRIPERHLVAYLDTYERPVRPRKPL